MSEYKVININKNYVTFEDDHLNKRLVYIFYVDTPPLSVGDIVKISKDIIATEMFSVGPIKDINKIKKEDLIIVKSSNNEYYLERYDG